MQAGTNKYINFNAKVVLTAKQFGKHWQHIKGHQVKNGEKLQSGFGFVGSLD